MKQTNLEEEKMNRSPENQSPTKGRKENRGVLTTLPYCLLVLALLLPMAALAADDEAAWPREIKTDKVVVLLYQPQLDSLVRDDDVRGPSREMRTAEPMPAWPTTFDEVLAFPRLYESHWDDSFGLRDKMLRGHSIFKVLGLGALAGLLFGLGASLVVEFLDPTIKDTEDLSDVGPFPVLARIPTFRTRAEPSR